MTTITPAVKEMQAIAQGGDIFTPTSTWNDNVASTSANHAYDLAAARTAMGLGAGQALFVIFSADGPFWANFRNVAAVIPTTNTTDGTAAEYCPNQRYIDGNVTSINIISAANQNVSMQFFRP